jgi:catechol 2,3-dioxygenase-like lactoylglutathione lyase family enzyme
MTTRVHVHIKVKDLQVSRSFYERFLGEPPVKVKSDQVKFLPSFAPLNLALTPVRLLNDVASNTVNHLGVELESAGAVMEHLARVKAAGLATRDQLKVNCCYANQTKFWVIDPDGVEWELYHVNFDLLEKHGGGIDRFNVPVA